MARVNYQFEKRKRDLEKKQKQEAKRLRKLAKRNPPGPRNSGDAAEPVTPPCPHVETRLTLLCPALVRTHRVVTLVYAARDEHHNNAVVLRQLLRPTRS